MKVEQVMTREVQTCGLDDRLNVAAQIMWDKDCGCVPVVDQTDGGSKVVGMITDRDICMAAYTQGRPLTDIPVSSVMATKVCACRGTDTISTALRTFEEHQVRRLPVLDRQDRLIGLLSLADIASEARRERTQSKKELTDVEVAEALEAITHPRQADIASAA